MPVNEIIFYQEEKVSFNNLKVAKYIAEKLGKKLILLLVDIPEEDKEKIVKELSTNNIDFEIRNQIKPPEVKEKITEEKPDLLILTREKISLLKHIFKGSPSEKFVLSLENVDILLLQEDVEKIEKILINVDKETSTPFFISQSFEFANKISSDVKFITSFHESYYEISLQKTHPEDEAKKIVLELFNEHISIIKEKIAKALKGKKTELIIVKGDPKKEVPYYARRNGYDLLIINENIGNKESYIENSEMSVGIFKDKEGE